MKTLIRLVSSVMLVITLFNSSIVYAIEYNDTNKVITTENIINIGNNKYDTEYLENDYNKEIVYDNITNVRNRLNNLDISNHKPYFSDTTKDYKYYVAIQSLAELGILNGTGNNKYNPNEAIKIVDLCKMIFNIVDPYYYNDLLATKSTISSIITESDRLGLDSILYNVMTGGYLANISSSDACFSILSAFGIRVINPVLYGYSYCSPIKYSKEIAIELGALENNSNIITRGEAANVIYTFLKNEIQFKKPDIMNDVEITYETDYLDLSSLLCELEKVPDEILSKFNARGWQIIAGDNKADEYYEDNKVLITGLCDVHDKTIYIIGYTATVHEFGHFLNNVTLHPFEAVTMFDTEINQMKSLRGPYCETNYSEFFAEAFTYYIYSLDDTKQMNKFKEVAPLTWAYFDRIANNNWELVSW